MQKHQKTSNNFIEEMLGAPTEAKSSGLVYSLITIGVIIASFLFMIIVSLAVGNIPQGEEPDWYLYSSYVLTPLVFLLVAIWLMKWTGSSWKTEASRQCCKARYYLIAIVLQIGLLSLSELNGLFLQFLARFGYQDTPIRLPSMSGFGFVGVLITIALLPAVFEELIFRGLLLKGMGSFGTVGAILLCGGLFALYHQNPAQTIYQFCCGAAFALVAIRAGSILPTVLSHFINNALIITLTKFGVDSFPAPVFVTILCVSALCLIGSLVWLIFFEKRTLADEDKTNKAVARKETITYALPGLALCVLVWLVVLLSGI